MPNFMILMTENDNAWEKMPPSEQDRILKLYFAWVDELKKKNQLRGGEPLGGPGRVLKMAGGKLVDGPFTKTKEVLTGFFIVEAKDLEAATQIESHRSWCSSPDDPAVKLHNGNEFRR